VSYYNSYKHPDNKRNPDVQHGPPTPEVWEAARKEASRVVLIIRDYHDRGEALSFLLGKTHSIWRLWDPRRAPLGAWFWRCFRMQLLSHLKWMYSDRRRNGGVSLDYCTLGDEDGAYDEKEDDELWHDRKDTERREKATQIVEDIEQTLRDARVAGFTWKERQEFERMLKGKPASYRDGIRSDNTRLRIRGKLDRVRQWTRVWDSVESRRNRNPKARILSR